MKSNLQISIPNPCQQNWHEMNVAERGKFCSACQKNVIDFTMQSDTSILNSIKENSNMCGRFLPNQLDRVLLERKEKSVYWQVGLASFLGFLGLGIPAPFPEWGTMLSDSKNFMETAPRLLWAPGLCLLFLILSTQLISDGLRDQLDPKLRGRG